MSPPVASPTAPARPAPRRPAPWFPLDLAAHGDREALVDRSGATLTYAELDRRVGDLASALGTERRLVSLAASNTIDSVVAYLAALRGGHPILLTGGGPAGDALVDAYDPDVTIRVERGIDLDERRHGTRHQLHRDLALLLSTSGSTGAPKLVRLSHNNLQSNAEAIATYLDITSDDVAPTTLPMQYCYGLSVINSYLLRGATILTTDLSVVDACFWRDFREHAATSLAGVPHTFELLDRVGFDGMELPTLRYVTQAGGRLAPEQVRRYAELGLRRGWRFFVMYGQTEATARMAYLPPELAERHPSAIGVAIPGGSLRIDRPNERGEGELVYQGPNVMLGYAEHPSDLRLGRTTDELRTGDIARLHDTGLFEIVGRAKRFIKPFGVRVDLDRVEELLARDGWTALCTGDDQRLVVGLERPVDVEVVRQLLRDRLALPAGAVRVVAVDELPRLESGKPDHQRLLELAEGDDRDDASAHARCTRKRPTIDRAFAAVAAPDALTDDATFVSLGGDSLSYVEVSVRLEEALGYLPESWHTTPLAELRALQPRHRRWPTVETSVVLRALAIVLVVGSHAGAFFVIGGAHVLLAVAGWNYARFRTRSEDTLAHLRDGGRKIARVAVPTVLYTAVLWLLVDEVAIGNVVLGNNYLADGIWRYWYWFVEVLVQVLAIVTVLLASRRVRHLEARAPFAFALGLLAITLALRLIPYGDPANDIYRTHTVAWLFVLGWLAHLATTHRRRLLVTAIVVASVPGAFPDERATLVAAGLLALLWVPRVRVPHHVNRLAAALAAASLWIYLTHWQVFPYAMRALDPAVATIATLAVGLAAWGLAERAGPAMISTWRRRRRAAIERASTAAPSSSPASWSAPTTRTWSSTRTPRSGGPTTRSASSVGGAATSSAAPRWS